MAGHRKGKMAVFAADKNEFAAGTSEKREVSEKKSRAEESGRAPAEGCGFWICASAGRMYAGGNFWP